MIEACLCEGGVVSIFARKFVVLEAGVTVHTPECMKAIEL